MKIKSLQIILACVAILASASWVSAQTVPGTYDPFTEARITALTTTNDVTTASRHNYTYTGDTNLTGSTFVFKVVGGTIITSKTVDTPVVLEDDGTYRVSEASNLGVITVEWDAPVSEVQKYVAVYEETADNCILLNTIVGMKITVTEKPTILLALSDTDVCSIDDILIDITIQNGSSPWTATINDGTGNKTFYFSTDDVTSITDYDFKAQVTPSAGSFTYNWVASGYLNTNTDGSPALFTFTANQIDDAITTAETGETGILGATIEVEATVKPLPVIGTMAQN